MKSWMSWECHVARAGRRYVQKEFWKINLRGRKNFEDVGMTWRVILKQILKKQHMRVWVRSNWLRIGPLADSCEYWILPSSCEKVGNFLLSNRLCDKKACAPWHRKETKICFVKRFPKQKHQLRGYVHPKPFHSFTVYFKDWMESKHAGHIYKKQPRDHVQKAETISRWTEFS